MKRQKILKIIAYVVGILLGVFGVVNCIIYWAGNAEVYPVGVNFISFIGYIAISIMFTCLMIKETKNE